MIFSENIMFGLIGTFIETTFKMSVIVTVSVGAFAYVTKPTDASFTTLKDKDKTVVTNIVESALLNTVCKPEFKDYVFFKTAMIPTTGKPIYYVGAFNNWFGK